MGTVVAIETEDGVVIAGDRRATRGGTVSGDSADRVFEVDGVGAGAVGDEGDVDEFRRRLETELDEAAFEREITADVLGRIAARVAEETGVEAAVAARDDEGVPRLRQVGPDGSTLSESTVALGSGQQIAFGRLEAADAEDDLQSAETFLREVLDAVAERDPHTGEAVDVWSLAREADEE